MIFHTSSRLPAVSRLRLASALLLFTVTPVQAQVTDVTAPAGESEMIQAADELWFRTSTLEMDDGGAAVIQGLTQVRTMLAPLVARGSTKPEAYWMIARAEYDLGEALSRTPELAEKNKEERRKLYENMIRLSTVCVEKIAPQDGTCWHWLATGRGRLATLKGVLNSLFAAEDVEDAWLKAYKLNPQYKTPGGEPMMNNIRYGLGVFYRMVPDSWLIKLVAGVRGDIRKGAQYFRDAIVEEPYRLELQKELAVALLCWDNLKGAPEKAAEGKAILEKIIAGEFDVEDRRSTDATDRRHASELLKNPAIACGYSRDGIQDLDESKIKR